MKFTTGSLLVCLLLVSATAVLSSCGSPKTSTSVNPAPPTQPTATPPSPSPSPAPDTYLATIICCSVGKTQSAQGQITIDTAANNGAGNVQIVNNGGNIGANETMTLQFCPFPQNFMSCINVTSLTTDGSGNANVNFTFPQKGTFSGVFQFVANGNQVLVTASASNNEVNFKSAELAAASVTGGINQTTGSAPGGGSMAVTGTTPHLVLNGTFPSHTFHVAECGISGNCLALPDVTTDAQGNANTDLGSLPPFVSTVFTVSDSSGVEFISAFRVQ